MAGARVQAWDVECDRRRREEFHDASADIARAQAEDAAALREALLSPARALRAELAKMAAEERDPFEGMSAAQLVRLSATTGRVFVQVVQVERLARGLSTENVEQLVPAEVERKSTAELEAYLTGCSDQWQVDEARGDGRMASRCPPRSRRHARTVRRAHGWSQDQRDSG